MEGEGSDEAGNEDLRLQYEQVAQVVLSKEPAIEREDYNLGYNDKCLIVVRNTLVGPLCYRSLSFGSVPQARRECADRLGTSYLTST